MYTFFLLAAIAAIAFFFATSQDENSSSVGILNPQSVRGSGRTAVLTPVPHEGTGIRYNRIAQGAAIAVAAIALLFAAGELTGFLSLNHTVEVMTSSVPFVSAAQVEEDQFTVEAVDEDDELVEKTIPGFWLYAVIKAHGQTIEMKASVTRSFDPLTRAGAIQLKVNSNWKPVRGRELRRALGRLSSDWFVEDGTGQTRLDPKAADDDVLERIGDAATHSAVYADEEQMTRRLQKPENVSEDATVVTKVEYTDDDLEDQEAVLVKEYRRQPVRPVVTMLGLSRLGIGEGVLDDLSTTERRMLYANLLEDLRERGEVVVADRDDAIFTAPSSTAKSVLRELQLLEGEDKYHLLSNMHAMRRAGVIVGRTGWFSIPLSVPNFTLPADESGDNELDGTVMVTTQVDRAFQGTLVGRKDGKLYAAKGIIRPPREGEQCGVTPKGALGADVTELDDAKFFVIDRCDESNSRLNVQAAAFSTEDRGKGVFTTWIEQIQDLGVEALMSGKNLDFYRAGLPAELVADDRDLTDKAHKLEIRGGYRGKVMGLGLGKDGEPLLGEREIRIPAKAVNEIQSRLGRSLKKGEELMVLRDPALSDGSGIQRYRFAGESEGDVVEISAFSQTWLVQGGDFDGDAAVVWHPEATPRLEPKDESEVDADSSKAKSEEFSSLKSSDRVTERSFLRRVDRWSSHIGISASYEQRAWAMSAELMEELRGPVAELLQGSIDAKKKPVKSSMLEEMDREISGEVNDLLDDAEYDLIDILGSHKNATGEAKEEAWEKLVNVAEDVTDRLSDGEELIVSDAAAKWLEHVLAVEDKRQELNEIRGGEKMKELPEETVQAAEDHLETAILPTEEGRQRSMLEAARKKWGAYMHRMTKADENGNERVASGLEEKAEYVVDTVRGMVADGRINPAMVLATKPGAHFALSVLSPADVREIMAEEDTEEITAESVTL